MLPTEQVTKTQYQDLAYVCEGKTKWRIVDTAFVNANGRFARTGPIYKGKDDLLADLERYAKMYGCAEIKSQA